MSDDEQQPSHPYVIKRIKKINKHHGGSWKIAYADFVTAMMAFFLLMWLLSMLNKYQLQGVAEYFRKPMKEAFTNQVEEKTTEKGDKVHKKSGDAAVKNDASKKMSPAQQLQQLQLMKQQLENELKNNPKLAEYKNQLDFIITSNGLKIVIRDLKNKPMFSSGKADFHQHSKELLTWVSNAVNKFPNRVVIIGHTDGKQYKGGGAYGNWELSSDRATATRRTLISNGMMSDKIVRVIGASDTDTLGNKDTLDSANRRIDIIVLTDEAFKRIQEEERD